MRRPVKRLITMDNPLRVNLWSICAQPVSCTRTEPSLRTGYGTRAITATVSKWGTGPFTISSTRIRATGAGANILIEAT